MLAKAKEKGGGTGKYGTGAIQSVDSMFVSGPREIGRKGKKRDINMLDYDRAYYFARNK